VSPDRIVWWVTIVALLVILALAGMRLARALRELKRITTRVDAYADLPLLKALERTERRRAALEPALAQIAPLVARAVVAVAVIRKGPVPPELVAAIRRIRGEVAAFRSFARR
jgi:type III secretory pathway component EscU